MSGLKSLIILVVLFSLHSHCQAKDFSHLYPTQQLQYIQSVYGKNIKAMLYQDIHAYLLPAERSSLSQIHFNMPLQSRYGVFDYRMNLNTGDMIIPALSVKFFDDISVALAWYESKHLDRSKIFTYIAKLHLEKDFLQTPLSALKIPDKAWLLDQYADDVSQKTLKSGLAFLLLHELAHWHYHHLPYDSIANSQAQEQEIQADLFALTVMGRMHTIPYGMVTWFLMTGLLQNNKSTTHPLSASRLYAIAQKIEDNPYLFIALENTEHSDYQSILTIAQNIRLIADRLPH